jgi:hypothetical protein
MHKLRLWIKGRGERVLILFVFFLTVSLVSERYLRKYVAIEQENISLKSDQNKMMGYISLLEKQSHTLIKQNQACFNDTNREGLEIIASVVHLRMSLIKTLQTGHTIFNVNHCEAVRKRIEEIVTTINTHQEFTAKQKHYLMDIVGLEATFFMRVCAKALDKI